MEAAFHGHIFRRTGYPSDDMSGFGSDAQITLNRAVFADRIVIAATSYAARGVVFIDITAIPDGRAPQWGVIAARRCECQLFVS
jgi:hypothetical protein